ncbi:hypothetical protein L218DRAFT_962262 [Marasmius fiardii PR-910]|nr:hypothetical protein L218DRAFT_962262 [Marasmius fiardii PR-910]
MPPSYLSISLAGSWISVFLCSMEITLGAYFFLNHKQNQFQKFILGSALLLDFLCTAVQCYNAWLHLDVLTTQTWCLGVSIMLTYVVSVLEQLYLVHRYWIIAQNKIVVSLIFLGVIVHLAFGFITGVYVLVIREFVYHFGVPASMVAAVTCAVTDLFIAINIFHTARSIDTSDSSTQSLLYRLSILAISSGVVTATATTLMIVLLFTKLEAFTFVFNLIGRIYVLTIVVNCIVLRRRKVTQVETLSLSETRSTRRSGSVVLTPQDFHTLTIPEDIETDGGFPSSRTKESVGRTRVFELRDGINVL